MKADQTAARAAIAPVVKEVAVPLERERAFTLFTAGVAGWWPLRSHSVAGEHAVGCRFEPWVGGQLFEKTADGAQHVWGTILEWDPPRRLVTTWHAGRTSESAQRLEVSFEEEGGGTRVRLVHSGWEALAAEAPGERDDYDSGWDYVLSLYTGAAASR